MLAASDYDKFDTQIICQRCPPQFEADLLYIKILTSLRTVVIQNSLKFRTGLFLRVYKRLEQQSSHLRHLLQVTIPRLRTTQHYGRTTYRMQSTTQLVDSIYHQMFLYLPLPFQLVEMSEDPRLAPQGENQICRNEDEYVPFRMMWSLRNLITPVNQIELRESTKDDVSEYEEPIPKRNRASKGNTYIGNSMQSNDQVAQHTPESLDETSPSFPEKHLGDQVPLKIRKVLDVWRFARSKNVDVDDIAKFTMNSEGVKRVYWNHGSRKPDKMIARYTNFDEHVLEVKPYLVHSLYPGLPEGLDRWILVAQNDTHGPWIIVFGHAISDGCVFTTWRGVSGYDKDPQTEVTKKWTGQSVTHTYSEPYPLSDGKEIPVNLVIEIQDHIKKAGPQKDAAIKDLTSTNDRFQNRRDGEEATFTDSDGSILEALSVRATTVSFLNSAGSHRRYLNFVIDSQGEGIVVRYAKHNPSPGVTSYEKWIPGIGFESKPSITKIGKTNYMFKASDNGNYVSGSFVDQDPSIRRTHGYLARDDWRSVIANTTRPNQADESIHHDVRSRAESRFIQNEHLPTGSSRIIGSGKDLYQTPPTSRTEEPRILLRFIHSFSDTNQPEYHETECQEAFELRDFRARLVKSGMFTRDEVKLGNFILDLSCEPPLISDRMIIGKDDSELQQDFDELMADTNTRRGELTAGETMTIYVVKYS